MAKPKEKTSLGARVKRYARVSTTAAGMAARVAGEKVLGLDIDHEKYAAQLRATLGALKGPMMKIAQILATIPDAVPPEYTRELSQLQADAPPMGWLFVKRRMAGELGPDWQKKFKSFEHEAAAAASLGQVHRAVLPDGRDVACKLQYPDMIAAVEGDLKQLGLFMALFEAYDRAIDTGKIQEEIGARLREELDYELEAKHTALYADMFKNTETVHVPSIVPELSTKRLLTMDWLEGARMAHVAETRKQTERNTIAMNMFHAWYTPFYHFGVIHGDPHLGNYTVRKDNSINLMDFGCVRVFSPKMVQGVIDLYYSILENDHERGVEAYKAWGFHNPSKELIAALNIWARFIYAPLLEDRARLIEETNTGLYGRQTATRMHDELRKLGKVAIPREFVFMDRAAIGLGAVFLRLKAEINWHQLFHAMIADFDVKKLAKEQASVLKKQGLAPN